MYPGLGSAEARLADFASVHPKVASAQLTVNLAVTLLTALIQALGMTALVVNPLVTAAAMAAASGLTVTLSLIENITVAKIAEADARDPDTVRAHVGRAYRTPSPVRCGASERWP
ncbi:hypothetical protein ACIQWR_37800 [Streptomyces sp. NPDC098789]|uniref:hypothetical protein n=1 Tax=Streptomyces sp. NPDC098789 TaxID=3366098 RepID=UPI0037FF3FFC